VVHPVTPKGGTDPVTTETKPVNWYLEMGRQAKDTNQLLADILRELVLVRELLAKQEKKRL
jgi:hypothetical protein